MCITQSELEGRLYKLHIYWDADKAPVQKTTVYAISRRGAMRKAMSVYENAMHKPDLPKNAFICSMFITGSDGWKVQRLFEEDGAITPWVVCKD